MIERKSTGIQRYGAIELSPMPFQHKSWKRLTPTKMEDINMEMRPISLTCDPSVGLEGNLQNVNSLHTLLDNSKSTIPQNIETSRKQLKNCYAVILNQLEQHQQQIIKESRAFSSSEALASIIQCELYRLQGAILSVKDCFNEIGDWLKLLSQPSHIGGKIEDNHILELVQRTLVHSMMFDLLYLQSAHSVVEIVCRGYFLLDTMNESASDSFKNTLSSLGSISLFLLGRYNAWWDISTSTENYMAADYTNICIPSENDSSDKFRIGVDLQNVQDVITQIQIYSSVYSNEYSVVENNGGSGVRSREDIFNKIEFFFQRFPGLNISPERSGNQLRTEDMLVSRQYFSTANSLVTALLSAGTIETATFHFVNVALIEVFQVAESIHAPQYIRKEFLTIQKCLSPLSWSTKEATMCAKSAVKRMSGVISRRLKCSTHGILCLIAFPIPYQSWNTNLQYYIDDALRRSHLVRSVYLLNRIVHNEYISSVFTADNDMFSMFLSILTQAANPVILQSSLENWIKDAICLRLLLLDTLDQLVQLCGTGDLNAHLCYLRIDGQSSGVRGLFLEAYQGLSLLSSYLQSAVLHLKNSALDFRAVLREFDHVLGDSLSASKYFSLVRRIQQSQPEAFALSHLNSTSSTVGMLPMLAEQFYNAWNNSERQRNDRTVLKVGFVSYSLTRHSVGRLLSKVIVELSAHPELYDVDIYVVANIPHIFKDGRKDTTTGSGTSSNYDDVTEFLQSSIAADRWIHLPAFTFGIAFQSTMTVIQSLNLDIVVYTDVLMQPSLQVWTHSMRLAPVQMAFWGHPYTGGDPDFIDYFITSKTFEFESTIINR